MLAMMSHVAQRAPVMGIEPPLQEWLMDTRLVVNPGKLI